MQALLLLAAGAIIVSVVAPVFCLTVGLLASVKPVLPFVGTAVAAAYFWD